MGSEAGTLLDEDGVVNGDGDSEGEFWDKSGCFGLTFDMYWILSKETVATREDKVLLRHDIGSVWPVMLWVCDQFCF